MKQLMFAGTVLALAILVSAVWATGVMAYGCRPAQEVGKWVNTSVGEADLIKLEISHSNKCSLPGKEWTPYDGPAWYVEATGECGDHYCSWGRVGAEQAEDRTWRAVQQDYRVKTFPIFAVFDRGGVQKYLYIHSSLEDARFLHVRVYTDSSGGRPLGISEDMIFRKSGPVFGTSFTLVPE